MKGCYHVVIYYLRSAAVIVMWPLSILAGMSLNSPQVRLGNLVLELEPWVLVVGSLACWVFVGSRVIRKL